MFCPALDLVEEHVLPYKGSPHIQPNTTCSSECRTPRQSQISEFEFPVVEQYGFPPLPISSSPMPLAQDVDSIPNSLPIQTILHKHYWVYNLHTKTSCLNEGFIDLRVHGRDPSAPAENVGGTVEMKSWQTAKVKHIKPAKVSASDKSWEVKLDYTIDNTNEVDNTCFGGIKHYIRVMDELDDNGHPFIMFHFEINTAEDIPQTVNIIGKRSNKYLSVREQKLLDIEVSEVDEERKHAILMERRKTKHELALIIEKRKLKLKKALKEKALKKEHEDRVEKHRKLFEEAGVKSFSEWWNKLGKCHFEAKQLAKELSSQESSSQSQIPSQSQSQSQSQKTDQSSLSQELNVRQLVVSPNKTIELTPRRPGGLKRRRSVSETNECSPKKVRFDDC